MKLKKIASLMLAGVMAVSMLAGCSNGNDDGGSTGGNTIVTPSTSSIVTALNNGQDADNKVKVTFSDDATLNSALKKAVEYAGDHVGDNTTGAILDYTIDLMGMVPDQALATKDWEDAFLKNGQKRTVIGIVSASSTAYWTENDFVNAVARDMNEAIADFDADNKNAGSNDTVGQKYFTFSYTGTASMVTSKQESGSTRYYIVYTITQTASEQTVKA